MNLRLGTQKGEAAVQVKDTLRASKLQVQLIPWLQLQVQWLGNISLQGLTQSKDTTALRGIMLQTQDSLKAHSKDSH